MGLNRTRHEIESSGGTNVSSLRGEENGYRDYNDNNSNNNEEREEKVWDLRSQRYKTQGQGE